MDADGRNPVQLTSNQASDTVPSWFPQMDQIAFLSNRNGHWQLWAIEISSGREKLLLDLDDAQYARLSPDGQQVMFNSRKGGPINLWTVPVAGGEARQLTFDQEMIGFPCWSPDGQFIAAEMKRGDDTHIVIMPG